MSQATRPLEPHELSYLLAERILKTVPPATPKHPQGMSAQAWDEVVWNTPMGSNPADYAEHYWAMQRPIGARS